MNRVNPILPTNKLYGPKTYFNYLKTFYDRKKFPKTILLSGKRGLGKFTLIYHFINYLFSKDTYDLSNNLIDLNSKTYLEISNGIFENLIYLKNDTEKKIGIDDIRALKDIILKSTLNQKERFIILDNVEKFNISSSNALLKIIEEPSEKNYFILIDNQENKLIETIASRCFKINYFLNKSDKLSIIKQLINHHKVDKLIEYEDSDITPGDYLNFNNICIEEGINPNLDYIDKVIKLLNLFKKSKNKTYIDISIFFTERLFYKLSLNKKNDILLLNNIKINTIKTINDFVLYNLNINSVTRSIISHLDYGK